MRHRASVSLLVLLLAFLLTSCLATTISAPVESQRMPTGSPVSTEILNKPSSTVVQAASQTPTVHPTLEPSATATPGNIGAITYVSRRDGRIDIYAVRLASGEITQITSDGKSKFDPKWSSDGKLAYLEGKDRFGPLNLIFLTDNLDEPKLIESFERVWDYGWSPDGKLLALTTQEARDGPWGLYIFPADLSTKSNLLPDYPYELFGLAWSPNGALIAVQTALEKKTGLPSDVSINRGILVVGLDGSSQNLISRKVPVADSLSWWPTSDQLLFTKYSLTEGQMFAAKLDGSEPSPIKLEGSAACTDHFYFHAMLAPDGGTLVFTQFEPDPKQDWKLCLAKADGTQVKQLFAKEGFTPEIVSWSPTSRVVAFLLFPSSRQSQTLGELFAIDLKNPEPVLLAKDIVLSAISWKP